MDQTQLDVLFVPVSGAKGSGEAQAALLLAGELLRLHPTIRLAVLLSRHSALAGNLTIPIALLEDSPTRVSAQVIALIHAHRPRVVLFDSTSRLAQLRAARDVGAITIFACWRAKSRKRALSIRKLALWRQFWLLYPPALDQPLSIFERIKLKYLARFELSALGTPAAAPDLLAARALLPQEWTTFVFLTPSGQYAIDEFRAFADALVLAGERVVLSVSAQARAPGHPNLIELERLPNATLLGLISLSARCAINGGLLLLQTVALGVHPLAIALMRDQDPRIARLRALGLCEAGQADARAWPQQLLSKTQIERATQAQRAAQFGIRNGLGDAVQRLMSALEN